MLVMIQDGKLGQEIHRWMGKFCPPEISMEFEIHVLADVLLLHTCTKLYKLYKYSELSLILPQYISIWVFPKIMVPPNYPF